MFFAYPWITLFGLVALSTIIGWSYYKFREQVLFRNVLDPEQPLHALLDRVRPVANWLGVLWTILVFGTGLYLIAGATQEALPEVFSTPGILIMGTACVLMYAVRNDWWIPKREQASTLPRFRKSALF